MPLIASTGDLKAKGSKHSKAKSTELLVTIGSKDPGVWGAIRSALVRAGTNIYTWDKYIYVVVPG